MLTLIDWQNAPDASIRQALCRPEQRSDVTDRVANIIAQVRAFGDEALLALTKELDGVSLSSLRVSEKELQEATISKESLKAIQQAIQSISYYHEALIPEPLQVDTAPGVSLKRIYRPITRVGLYVPGGHCAPLVSSLLMQAIPAYIAGCPSRSLCTPPNRAGLVDPHLLVAARLCNIKNIYKVGGAQAIAAMAYGTATVSKVDKLFGPGNGYVTEAKLQVAFDSQGAAIDMPAGPSEVMILADEKANPDWVAADLLAQAEHGVDSQVILICESVAFARKVNQALVVQMDQLSRRAIIQEALLHGKIVICENRLVQFTLINEYAPEHLILHCADAKKCVDHITSAGTIFVGPWAAETMGDYVTGSNHVLPTNGFARNHSGLSTCDFLKAISVQSVSEIGVKNVGFAAETLARLEGLDAHAFAVRIRLDALIKDLV